jgi:uncharacterized protein YktB (UPF0637 family)
LPFPYNNPMFGQSNVYQQMLQQYQQNMTQPQQGVTIFTNVPSEEVARRSDVPPNTTRNFINENEGYVYLKSVGMSILEPYVFKTFKLVEVTDEPQTKTATNETESPQVDMNS